MIVQSYTLPLSLAGDFREVERICHTPDQVYPKEVLVIGLERVTACCMEVRKARRFPSGLTFTRRGRSSGFRGRAFG